MAMAAMRGENDTTKSLFIILHSATGYLHTYNSRGRVGLREGDMAATIYNRLTLKGNPPGLTTSHRKDQHKVQEVCVQGEERRRALQKPSLTDSRTHSPRGSDPTASVIHM